MDLKGDLSGIAKAGVTNPKIDERHAAIGIPFVPNGSSVEFLTLSKENGAKLRATVSEFGPVLFSKVFGPKLTFEYPVEFNLNDFNPKAILL